MGPYKSRWVLRLLLRFSANFSFSFTAIPFLFFFFFLPSFLSFFSQLYLNVLVLRIHELQAGYKSR